MLCFNLGMLHFISKVFHFCNTLLYFHIYFGTLHFTCSHNIFALMFCFCFEILHFTFLDNIFVHPCVSVFLRLFHLCVYTFPWKQEWMILYRRLQNFWAPILFKCIPSLAMSNLAICQLPSTMKQSCTEHNQCRCQFILLVKQSRFTGTRLDWLQFLS
jgi:hypothetical protein